MVSGYDDRVIWQLDHIAVAAATLDEGAAWVEDRLGAPLVPGGRHAEMGTHNRLMSLGPGLYLEVIAIDPDAPPPGQRRWFGLDDFSGPPRLAVWMVRTSDIATALKIAPLGSGEPIDFARGDYRWRLAVPRDGRATPLDGCAPALIEWQGDRHPADDLPHSEVRLVGLRVTHPEPLIRHLSPVDGVEFAAGFPSLRAVFDTPLGERALG